MALDSIEARLSAFADTIEQNEEYFQRIVFLLFDHYQRNPSAQGKEAVQTAAARYRDVIMQVVGENDPDLGAFVFAYINGLMVLRIVSGDGISLRKQCRLLIDLIRLYLTSKKGNAGYDPLIGKSGAES